MKPSQTCHGGASGTSTGESLETRSPGSVCEVSVAGPRAGTVTTSSVFYAEFWIRQLMIRRLGWVYQKKSDCCSTVVLYMISMHLNGILRSRVRRPSIDGDDELAILSTSIPEERLRERDLVSSRMLDFRSNTRYSIKFFLYCADTRYVVEQVEDRTRKITKSFQKFSWKSTQYWCWSLAI
jgi:hypothetical protein